MPNYRVPLLVWQDLEGFWTAAPVEIGLAGDDAAAVEATAERAVKQLQAYLQWWFKKNPWLSVPDFLEPELIYSRVSVRPQYREGQRVYPCAEEIELRVPGVHGHQESGLRICSLPTLDVAFHFYAAGDLRRMIAETVRRRLVDLTPQALSRFLPPPQSRLQEVSVRVADPKPSRNPYAELPTLMQTAQAIGEPSYRRRFSASWQREGELAQLIHKLGGERANVAIVGEHGAGKSTLLVNAVRALERSVDDTDKTAPIVRRRYWLTTAGRLIAGMRYLGEWQIRCETVIGELSAIDGVLCVENLLDLVLLGGTAPAGSIAAFMIPFLQNGQLRLVAETTPEEFDACRRLLPGLADVFQVLRLDPMHPRQARAALAAVADQRAARDQDRMRRADSGHRRLSLSPLHALPCHAGQGGPIPLIPFREDEARRPPIHRHSAGHRVLHRAFGTARGHAPRRSAAGGCGRRGVVPRADHRPERGLPDRGRDHRHVQGGAQRSAAAAGHLALLRADRRRQDGAGQGDVAVSCSGMGATPTA